MHYNGSTQQGKEAGSYEQAVHGIHDGAVYGYVYAHVLCFPMRLPSNVIFR